VGESPLTAQVLHGGAHEASPYGIRSNKLVIWLFIVADAATFGAILFAYGYLRLGSPDWTRPFAVWPTIINGVVMTVVLLTSSLTMIAAVRAARSAGRGGGDAARWLAVTVGLGVVFAALHLREWFAMLAEGWRPSQNPLGGSVLFGATFFSITGLHLLHVVGGVVALTVVAIKFRRGRLNADHVETAGLYWHCVDLVWMFVFPLVYLMNAR